MSILRFTAWVALLIIVVSVAYALFIGKELTQQLIQVPAPQQALPRYEYRPECTNHTYIDPWTVANSYGLSVENNAIVYKYTNTSEEAEKVLNNTSIDPELYYYYYSILTALVAIPKGSYSTVYDLHPLPVSQNDVENLTKLSLCFYLPSEGFEVPSIEPAVTANTSYIIKNVTVYKRESFRGLTVLTPVNVTKIINIATYLPTANILILNSTHYADPVNVTGFATGSISAERVGEVVCGNTTAYFAEYNTTGYIIYVCSVYNISYSISLGYEVNRSRTITDSFTGSTLFTASNCNGGALCSSTVASFEGGSYNGFKPLAKAVIEATSYYVGSETRIDGTPYLYEYYYTSFSVDTYTRSLRLYKVTATINANLSKVLTGVLSTMKLIVESNGSRIELPINISKPIINASVSAYPRESREFNASIYLSDVASIAGSRVLNFTRTVKVASISMSILKPETSLDSYAWNTVIDVKPIVDIKTWSIKAPSINITAIQKLLSPNPGELWLEKLTLRYIHDKIAQFIVNNTAMNQYFDVFMWLLVSQLPANMGNCSHETATPLLDALSNKCGSEIERVKILHNITSYSLDAQVKNISLYYPSYNGTAVNATVCIATIQSYPPLWNLYNETISAVYALPADNGYKVFYNIYENSPFGDWRRVKE
jgi:hypothetical protein